MSHVVSVWDRLSRRCSAFVVAVLLSLPAAGAAQTISGQISGRITDSSGGVLPGVTVTIVNEGTGFTDTRVTDVAGVYTFTNLRVGTYSVAAELQGFRKEQRTGFSLTADGRLSADFSLGVGEINEAVEVTAVMGETVNRTNGEVARTIDGAADQGPGLQRAQLSRARVAHSRRGGNDYIPRARDQPQHRPASRSTAPRQHQQPDRRRRINLDSGSNGSQINNVSLDFIQQVKIQTSNFSAEFGRNSGAAINVVTQQRHQPVAGHRPLRFFRDEHSTSRTTSPPRTPTATRRSRDSSSATTRARSAGRSSKQLFFFGGQQYRVISRFTNPSRQTVPTTAELNGDFSFRLRGTDNMVGTADDGVAARLRRPAQAVPGQRHSVEPHHRRRPGDRQRLSHDDSAGGGVHRTRRSPTTRPISWTTPSSGARTSSASTTGQRLAERLRALSARRVRPGRALRHVLRRAAADHPDQPPASGLRLPGGHTWVVSSKLVNEAEGQRRRGTASASTPVGDNWRRDTYDFQFPGALRRRAYRRRHSQRQRHRLRRGPVGPSSALLSPTTDIMLQDTLTLHHGQPLAPQRASRSRATGRTRTAARRTSGSSSFSRGG